MNIKKVTQKGADGSSITYEFDVPKMQDVPAHPGGPKGPDTVPAWLTPGEFVMNAEATRMFEPQIEAMNNAGRAVQRQQGGTIPEYKADGGVVDNSVERYGIPSDYKGNVDDAVYNAMSNPTEQSYTYKPGQTEDRNQNIYNFAYEGKIGLDTVPNATPFDKSIIMQAMNDAQGKPVNSDVTLEDLTNRIEVPKAEMPGLTQSPELGFYGQVPPAINPDYIQDNANVTSELLGERYSDPSRQQPATSSNIVDAMASVPNPDDLSPMDVPRSFEDNGIPIGSAVDYLQNNLGKFIDVDQGIQTNKDNFNAIGDALSGVVNFMKAGNTSDIVSRQRDADRQGVTVTPRGQEDKVLAKIKERYNNGDITKDEYDRLYTNVKDSVLLNESSQQTVLENRKQELESEIERGKEVGANTSAQEDELKVVNSNINTTKDNITIAKGESVKDAIAKTKGVPNPDTDDVSDNEVTKAGLAYLENIENIKSGKGPSNGDTGDIYTGSFLDKAEGLLSSVGSFFKDNFSTLLDDDKLKNAALLYLGSRAMGYSHAGSLNFVGKRYMGQIESKLKTADQAALTGKYSKESISKYRDTGNPSDLVMNKTFSIVGTKDMVDTKTGKTIAVTTYKDDNTGKLIHQSVDGKPIPNIGALRTQADEDAKFNNFKSTIVSNIEGELKRITDEETRAKISSVIPNPQGFAGEAYEVARRLGLDTAKINSLVPSMIREMIRDTNSGITINETAVQSYFNKQLINLSLKEYEVKANLNNANTQELSKINAMIPNSSNPVVLSKFWRGAGEEFGNLSDKEKKFYSDRADEKLGITPMMVFVKEELSALSK